MINILPIALIGMLATAATSTPFKHKRQYGQQVIFRTDLRADLTPGVGQSPEFKGVYLSHTQGNSTGQYVITFIDAAEKANADRGIVESRGIPIGIGKNTTLYMNMGTNKGDQKSPQPVTLGTKQESAGWFTTDSGELTVSSSDPTWYSWLICEGTNGYPTFSWLGLVNDQYYVVPPKCSPVRLYADGVSNSSAN